MQEHPDSALSILEEVDTSNLRSKKEKARYALLMSMALDKNYIDTTDFNVLQPAIDYYFEKGTPDEKLRTHLYQGRIYHNKGDKDMAMQCYLRGKDLKDEITDTLTLANLYAAQSSISYLKYDINDFIKYNLEAAKLYESIGHKDYEIISLLCALDGSFFTNDKKLADMLITIVRQKCKGDARYSSKMEQFNLSYIANFGTKSEFLEFMSHYDSLDSINENFKLDIAYAYRRFGDGYNAKRVLNMVDTTSAECDYERYLAIKPNVLALNGDYAEALEAYHNFSSTIDSTFVDMLNHNLYFVENRHDAEKQSLITIRRKNNLIRISITCTLLILLVTVIIYYLYRLRKKKSLLLESDKKKLELRHDSLLKEYEKLDIERENAVLDKQSAEAECNRHKLEAENLLQKIRNLEEEDIALKEILGSRNDFSKPVADAIKTRIEILNSLFAAQIKNTDANAKSNSEWIEQIINDKDEFINTTRLAFKASHPKFIEYLESHELTTDEINYVCLYAIGLRGKDIGNYTQEKRHYHKSSDIRKKLGLIEQDTNLSIFIKSLLKKL